MYVINRHRIWLPLGAGAALAATAPTVAQDFEIIDNFDDADLEGWVITDADCGCGEWSAETGEACLRTTENVFVDAMVIEWGESVDDPARFADGVIRMQLRTDGDDDRHNVGLVVRTDFEPPERLKGYLFFFAPVNGNFLAAALKPEYVQLDSVNVGVALGEDWIIQAELDGGTINLKTWRVGECEPAAPQIEIVDDTFSEGSFGAIGILGGGRESRIDFCMDNVFYAPSLDGRSPDVDGNGRVDFQDVLRVLSAWGECPDPEKTGCACPEDIDEDGSIGFSDLLEVLARWT